jgi:uncharacterized coiled-coil protein SlyX
VIVINERLAFVEGRMAEQSQMFTDIRQALAGLDARMDRLDGRFDSLQNEQSKNFRWMVGIQVTTLVTLLVALFGAVGFG